MTGNGPSDTHAGRQTRTVSRRCAARRPSSEQSTASRLSGVVRERRQPITATVNARPQAAFFLAVGSYCLVLRQLGFGGNLQRPAADWIFAESASECLILVKLVGAVHAAVDLSLARPFRARGRRFAMELMRRSLAAGVRGGHSTAATLSGPGRPRKQPHTDAASASSTSQWDKPELPETRAQASEDRVPVHHRTGSLHAQASSPRTRCRSLDRPRPAEAEAALR
jgi:hypothetical protein